MTGAGYGTYETSSCGNSHEFPGKSRPVYEKIWSGKRLYGICGVLQIQLPFTKHKEDETPIELVIPLEGVLATYNNGKGGMHHIAFEVEDVEEVKRKYEAEGMKLLEESAVPGAGGIIVNFLRPRFGEGILVEFVQKLKK